MGRECDRLSPAEMQKKAIQDFLDRAKVTGNLRQRLTQALSAGDKDAAWSYGETLFEEGSSHHSRLHALLYSNAYPWHPEYNGSATPDVMVPAEAA
jgi:hypothetical protein